MYWGMAWWTVLFSLCQDALYMLFPIKSSMVEKQIKIFNVSFPLFERAALVQLPNLPPPLFHTWNVVTTFQWISCYTRGAVAVVGSSDGMGLVKKFQSMLYYTLDSRVPVFFMTMGENRKCQHMFWLTLKMVRGDWAERDNQRGSKVEEVCSKHLSNL